ncbi:MAG: DegT/DnrJ/EryC1/StrS aminotransferase family protein, partial [Candidatus Sumerlaeota bacterium]|nr:DegT/DnrJ/EryC1/StrS aminotransferase family protein [Candidatus Sumerlaeota bacterium]
MAISFADIPLQHAHLRDKFIEKVNDLLDSGQFILTKTVSDFEEAFAEFVGCNYAVGVNSCADALFFALKLLSIGEGDEVICPGFAPMHVADSVFRAGAKPILVDIDPKTFCINPDKIEEALSPKIKAIIPTHLFGKACDMARIMELANARGLQVIEDVSQAAGAEIEEQFCGALGKFGCFGFDPASNLGAIGDAGMLTTNDEENYRKALMLRDHGRERMGGAYEMIGFNSRLDAIQAVYLDLKIEDLEEANKDRVENARMYEKL